jgi:hypothetical protein
MYSYADRHTHDFFFGRDYPPVALLDRIFAKLVDQPQSKETVRKLAAMDEDVFDKALEKLWIHKGAVVDFAENVSLWRRELASFLHRAGGAEAGPVGGNHPLRGEPSLPDDLAGSPLRGHIRQRRGLRNV